MRSFRTWTLALLAAGLLAGSCGGGGYNSNPTPTPSTSGGGGTTADVIITINGINGDMSFSPNPATAKVGQKVAWRNNGGTEHTATQNAGAFDTGSIANGGTSTVITMSAAGSFAYHCNFHPTMVGTLNVTQ